MKSLVLKLFLLCIPTVGMAASPVEHIWFEDTCSQEPAAMVLKSWLQGKNVYVGGAPNGMGSNTQYRPARIGLRVHLDGLKPNETFYLRVELLQHDENDLEERVIEKVYEDERKAGPDGKFNRKFNRWSLPLRYSNTAGRLTARVFWTQGDRGGVRSTSLLWRENPEDVVQVDPKAECFWQGPLLFRSGYRSNDTSGLMTITERQYLFRNFGSRAGIDLGFSTSELESFYPINRDDLSTSEIELIKRDRPFQGLLPGGVGAWFTSSTRFEELRQDTLSLFHTYILGAGEGGFYVGREVFSRFKARRYCLAQAENNSCQVWRLCEVGHADIGFMDKGFAVVPADIVHDAEATRSFVESWQSLEETCKVNPKNSPNFKRISQPNLDAVKNELPVIYFRGR